MDNNLNNTEGLAILHIGEKILSAEDTNKLDEIYDYIKNSGDLLEKLSKNLETSTLDMKPINITINSEPNKDLKFSEESLEKMIKRVLSKQSERYKTQ